VKAVNKRYVSDVVLRQTLIGDQKGIDSWFVF